MKNLSILVPILIFGLLYYILSIKKKEVAFSIKISLLIWSFILATSGEEFVVIGPLAFGGESSVMMIIFIEIVDTVVEKELNKKC